MRVLKWDVPVDDCTHLIGSGQVLHVACQYGPETVQVWTLEDSNPERSKPTRAATVVGTGHEAPDFWVPLGSAVTAGGQLVWHVFGEPQ